MVKTILLVEDEREIRELVKKSFIDAGYIVEEASDGVEALEKVHKKIPDLVILDLGLPKISGETVCQEIKKDYPSVPVIMLSAKSQSDNIVKGLTLGADDYMTKPFVMDELMARAKTRLNDNGRQTKLVIADLEINYLTKETIRGGKKIDLTPKEFELLYYLMANSGQVLSREQILNKIWLYSPEIESRAVDVYIGYLRRKIDSHFKKKLLKSIRGFGYTVKED